MFLNRSVNNLSMILGFGKIRLVVVVAAAIYFLIYLTTDGNIIYSPKTDLSLFAPIPSVRVLDDWPVKISKTISPFVWEPIAVIYPANHWRIFISVPNMLVAFLLATLIGLNMAVAAYNFILPKSCRRGSMPLKGLLGAAPSLLTGFVCCVPTVVVILGSAAASATLGLIAIRPLFLPASIIALTLVLVWSTTRSMIVSEMNPNTASV